MNRDSAFRKPSAALRLFRWGVRHLPRKRPLIASWACRHIFGKGPYLTEFDDDQCVCPVDLGELGGRILFFEGCWEPVVTAVYNRLLQSSETVFDVGALNGYFTLLAWRRALPGGRVVAFEPDEKSLASLRATLDLNGCAGVFVEPVAAGSSNGEGFFAPGSELEPAHGALIGGQPKPGQSVVRVKTVTLDAYCRDRGITQVDLLKMDIEGGEDDALTGMHEGLKTGVFRHILLELHPGHLRARNSDPRHTMDRVLRHGYSCWLIRDAEHGFKRPITTTYSRDLLVPCPDDLPAKPFHLLFSANGEEPPD